MHVMPYTGQDYAQAPKQDMVTAIGMRLAMFDVVKRWDALPEDQKTAEKARKLIIQAPLDHALLQAAGTQEIVSRFYADIAHKNSDADIVWFVNDIGKADITRLEQSLQHNKPGALAKAAGAFSKASRQHLQMGTVTETFRNFLKDHQEKLADIVIEPKPLRDAQAQMIDDYERKFRTADTWDDRLYRILPSGIGRYFQKKLGIAYPAVTQHIAEFDPEKERHLGPIIGAARRLSDGTSRNIDQDIRSIQNEASHIEGLRVPVISGNNVSDEQAKKIGHDVLDAVLRLRMDHPAATLPAEKEGKAEPDTSMHTAISQARQVAASGAMLDPAFDGSDIWLPHGRCLQKTCDDAQRSPQEIGNYA